MSDRISVIPNNSLESGPSTAGMVRKSAVSEDGIWLGEVHTEPGSLSGWHHHGEHTTYGHVIAGELRFEFGLDGREVIDAHRGDFFVVPPYAVHREGNPSADEQVLVAIRVGTGPTVINVEGPDAT